MCEKSFVPIAEEFLSMFLKNDWKGTKELTKPEVQALLKVLTAAGFEEVEKVVSGILLGNIRDQNGPTGETYRINYYPIKAIGSNGKDHFQATSWLDCILKSIDCRRKQPHNKSIDFIVCEIERSIPFSPIQLTTYGDFLEEYPRQGPNPDHTRDDSELGESCVGIHKYCRDWIDRKRSSENYDVLLCRSCHLRVYIPKSIVTFGQLRQYMQEVMSESALWGPR